MAWNLALTDHEGDDQVDHSVAVRVRVEVRVEERHNLGRLYGESGATLSDRQRPRQIWIRRVLVPCGQNALRAFRVVRMPHDRLPVGVQDSMKSEIVSTLTDENSATVAFLDDPPW
jgi:hypothetical protein